MSTYAGNPAWNGALDPQHTVSPPARSLLTSNIRYSNYYSPPAPSVNNDYANMPPLSRRGSASSFSSATSTSTAATTVTPRTLATDALFNIEPRFTRKSRSSVRLNQLPKRSDSVTSLASQRYQPPPQQSPWQQPPPPQPQQHPRRKSFPDQQPGFQKSNSFTSRNGMYYFPNGEVFRPRQQPKSRPARPNKIQRHSYSAPGPQLQPQLQPPLQPQLQPQPQSLSPRLAGHASMPNLRSPNLQRPSFTQNYKLESIPSSPPQPMIEPPTAPLFANQKRASLSSQNSIRNQTTGESTASSSSTIQNSSCSPSPSVENHINNDTPASSITCDSAIAQIAKNHRESLEVRKQELQSEASTAVESYSTGSGSGSGSSTNLSTSLSMIKEGPASKEDTGSPIEVQLPQTDSSSSLVIVAPSAPSPAPLPAVTTKNSIKTPPRTVAKPVEKKELPKKQSSVRRAFRKLFGSKSSNDKQTEQLTNLRKNNGSSSSFMSKPAKPDEAKKNSFYQLKRGSVGSLWSLSEKLKPKESVRKTNIATPEPAIIIPEISQVSLSRTEDDATDLNSFVVGDDKPVAADSSFPSEFPDPDSEKPAEEFAPLSIPEASDSEFLQPDEDLDYLFSVMGFGETAFFEDNTTMSHEDRLNKRESLRIKSLERKKSLSRRSTVTSKPDSISDANSIVTKGSSTVHSFEIDEKDYDFSHYKHYHAKQFGLCGLDKNAELVFTNKLKGPHHQQVPTKSCLKPQRTKPFARGDRFQLVSSSNSSSSSSLSSRNVNMNNGSGQSRENTQDTTTKNVNFSSKLYLNETYSPSDYDRFNLVLKQTYSMLSHNPAIIKDIRAELNNFKKYDMPVHDLSRGYTHFFRN